MPEPEQYVTLYTPVGPDELRLIRESGNRAFLPPPSEERVLGLMTNEERAAQIARGWAIRFDGKKGYFIRCNVPKSVLARFDRKTFGEGERQYEEYLIPAERLDEFNAYIIGPIEVIASAPGEAEARS